jgi:parallel beta-helix repeat protein
MESSMSKRTLSIIALAVMVVGLRAESALARTVVVEGDGGVTCNPGPQHFTTIQAAVNAVSISPGSTVLVCPGSYPEQVVIGQQMTLKGITNGTAGAAIITVPAGGLVPNVTTPAYGLVAAQVLVQNTANVRVDGMIVDGTGSTCPTLAGANRTIGIEFLNIGGPSWLIGSGFISNDVVRYQVDGCGLGEAINSENSFVTITNNEVHHYDRDGIVVTGGAGNVNGNNSQGGAFYGIALHGASKSLVYDNNMYGAEGMIFDAGTSGVLVYGNIMGPFTGTGISLNQVSGITVINNEVDASYAGYVLYQSSGNIVQFNTAFNMSSYGIVDEQSGGRNNISNNTVNEAAFGLVVYQSPGTTDVLAPNTLVNCTVTTTTNPF